MTHELLVEVATGIVYDLSWTKYFRDRLVKWKLNHVKTCIKSIFCFLTALIIGTVYFIFICLKEECYITASLPKISIKRVESGGLIKKYIYMSKTWSRRSETSSENCSIRNSDVIFDFETFYYIEKWFCNCDFACFWLIFNDGCRNSKITLELLSQSVYLFRNIPKCLNSFRWACVQS